MAKINTEVAQPLVLTFLIFFISYLMRPIGALFYGYIGDNLSRRTALLLSIAMMNISMLMMAFLPTWQTIGFVAPVLLLIFRIVQGISTGGEMAGAFVYVLESIEVKRHGRYGGFIWSMPVVGVLIGSIITASVATILTQGQLYTWGWRIPYFIGIGLGSIIFILRTFMPESIAFVQAKSQHINSGIEERFSLLKGVCLQHKLNTLLIIFLVALPAASMTFILMYFTKPMHQYLELSKVFWGNTIILLILILAMVFLDFCLTGLIKYGWLQ